MRPVRVGGPVVACVAILTACFADRTLREDVPVYEHDVADLLAEHCGECHSGDEPEGGWRVTTYLETIGCVASTGESAVLPSDETSPVIRGLERANHQDLLDEAQRARLSAWVRAGALPRKGAAHDPGIIDPRSEAFHGRILRDQRWAPMFETDRPDACGRCHDGAPARPEGIRFGATNATACTECHSDPEGVLACGTCHGGPGRAHPPADPCFATERPVPPDAHAKHLQAGDVRAEALTCEDCHPERDAELTTGAHGDGTVDVELNPEAAGEDASFDSASATCTVACHNRGGNQPQPSWHDEGPMECDDCHASPPEEHNPDACNRCHADVNEEGDELYSPARHVNGEADVAGTGDECGVCHGSGDDPWPDTGRHPQHLAPEVGPPVPCETCHVVPEDVDDEEHLDDSSRAEVAFSGLAGDDARYDVEASSCAVWCHTRDGARAEPSWDEEGPLECGDCHETPPPDHSTSSCNRCHLEVTPDGDGLVRHDLHVNGAVDLGDGTDRCGACHGSGDDPWPDTGRHQAHMAPTIAAPIECTTCHVVPVTVRDDGHLDTTLEADVFLSGLAAARGAVPTFDGTACASVACHGYGLIDPVDIVLRWDDPESEAGRCGTCHGLPPAWPHPDSTTCESLMCHGGEVARWPDGPHISTAGRALHINGVIDAGRRAP